LSFSKPVARSLLSVLGLWLLGASACADGAADPPGNPAEGSPNAQAGAASDGSIGSAGAPDSHAGHGNHTAGTAGGTGASGADDGSGGSARGGGHPGHGGSDSSGQAAGGTGDTGAHAGSGGSHDGHPADGGVGAASEDGAGGEDEGSAGTGGTSHEGHGATGATGSAGSGATSGEGSGGGGSGATGTTGGTGTGASAGTSSHEGHGATGGTASAGSAGSTGGSASGNGGSASGNGGSASGVGGTNTGGSAAAGSGNVAGTGGTAHEHDHCVDGEFPDPRDALLATPSAPDIFVASNGDVDLPLPEPVLDWMDVRVWKPSHDAWHNIRRCGGGSGPGGETSSSGSAVMCAHTELVPEHQECEDAENGYEFLVMHRHMLIALRQAFPNHADLFAGFPHFPFEAQDVPEEWRDRFGSGWTQNVLNTARTLESIEQNLSRFPTEGDLGKYIQCGMAGVTSIHGALHFKWVVNESPNSLGKQSANLGNYMFWKLHGWIDGIWERYRVAKGLAADEPKLVAAITAQCREMHALGEVIDPNAPGPEPLPEEHGYFHEQVRPAFERLCSGCHDDASPEAGMSLGGAISSANVVANLVNVQSAHGGQFARVVPGHPEQSWLYLKASGLAAEAGCEGESCNTQSMPPGATADRRLTATELANLEQWILDGAPAPTE
jgi:hypothetical protein